MAPAGLPLHFDALPRPPGRSIVSGPGGPLARVGGWGRERSYESE